MDTPTCDTSESDTEMNYMLRFQTAKTNTIALFCVARLPFAEQRFSRTLFKVTLAKLGFKFTIYNFNYRTFFYSQGVCINSGH